MKEAASSTALVSDAADRARARQPTTSSGAVRGSEALRQGVSEPQSWRRRPLDLSFSTTVVSTNWDGVAVLACGTESAAMFRVCWIPSMLWKPLLLNWSLKEL